MKETVRPQGWKRPSGYSDGIIARGRILCIAGQIGCDAGRQLSPDFSDQAAAALQNVATILRAAGGAPEDVIRMTWFVTDLREYRAAKKAVGARYREIFGSHYPAMTLVEVSALLEPGAKLEIEATAVIS